MALPQHQRHRITGAILEHGIVAVIRADDAATALACAHACEAGGIRVLEVALTTPGGLRVIETLRRTWDGGPMVIGAGTVLDETTARLAVDAGAQYLVTPALNPDVVRLCHRYQLASLPGAMTVREVIDALESGADLIKLFPGESLGPSFLKAIRAPLPQAPLMPTGGVSADNAAAWIQAGAVALGVGGSLTNPGLKGDLAEVTARAQALVAAVQLAREAAHASVPASVPA